MNVIRRSLLKICRALNACDKYPLIENQEKKLLCQGSAMTKDSAKAFEEGHQKAVKLVEFLKDELSNLDVTLRNQLVTEEVEKLKIENQRLKEELNLWQAKVVELETQHGIKQVPLPSSASSTAQGLLKPSSASAEAGMQGESSETSESQKKDHPAKKTKKIGSEAPKKAEKPDKTTIKEPAINVGRLELRVGRIVSVERHPDADSLYVEKIDLGEDQPRTIVSGLVKFVPIEEMQNRLVMVLCNLKPAKMRGITSEGMVMCASTPDKVEVLDPPTGAVPGDMVLCEEHLAIPDAVLNPKKKIFEQVAPDLKTNADCVATYKSAPLAIRDKGVVKAATLAGVQIK